MHEIWGLVSSSPFLWRGIYLKKADKIKKIDEHLRRVLDLDFAIDLAVTVVVLAKGTRVPVKMIVLLLVVAWRTDSRKTRSILNEVLTVIGTSDDVQVSRSSASVALGQLVGILPKGVIISLRERIFKK